MNGCSEGAHGDGWCNSRGGGGDRARWRQMIRSGDHWWSSRKKMKIMNIDATVTVEIFLLPTSQINTTTARVMCSGVWWLSYIQHITFFAYIVPLFGPWMFIMKTLLSVGRPQPLQAPHPSLFFPLSNSYMQKYGAVPHQSRLWSHWVLCGKVQRTTLDRKRLWWVPFARAAIHAAECYIFPSHNCTPFCLRCYVQNLCCGSVLRLHKHKNPVSDAASALWVRERPS